jgi:4'-phosphopantetheinyl transferase EntD
MLRALVGEEPEIAWDRLLFSAKEAVFKAWFPLTRRPLGFTQSILRFEIAAGTFTARLCVDVLSPDGEWPNPLRGHWFARDGLVLTAIALEYGAERIAE